MGKSLKFIIEALLFASDKPLMIKDIKSCLDDVKPSEIKSALQVLKYEYEAMARSFTLKEVASGFQLRSHSEYGPYIMKLLQSSPERLSRAAMETLAIVAYKQPIIRQEVEKIRGVDVGGILRTLLEKNLVKVLGRKDLPGKPLIYGTTKKFLELFDLKDLDSLPNMKEMKNLGAPELEAQDKIGETFEGAEQGLQQENNNEDPVTETDPETQPKDTDNQENPSLDDEISQNAHSDESRENQNAPTTSEGIDAREDHEKNTAFEKVAGKEEGSEEIEPVRYGQGQFEDIQQEQNQQDPGEENPGEPENDRLEAGQPEEERTEIRVSEVGEPEDGSSEDGASGVEKSGFQETESELSEAGEAEDREPETGVSEAGESKDEHPEAGLSEDRQSETDSPENTEQETDRTSTDQ